MKPLPPPPPRTRQGLVRRIVRRNGSRPFARPQRARLRAPQPQGHQQQRQLLYTHRSWGRLLSPRHALRPSPPQRASRRTPRRKGGQNKTVAKGQVPHCSGRRCPRGPQRTSGRMGVGGGAILEVRRRRRCSTHVQGAVRHQNQRDGQSSPLSRSVSSQKAQKRSLDAKSPVLLSESRHLPPPLARQRGGWNHGVLLHGMKAPTTKACCRG